MNEEIIGKLAEALAKAQGEMESAKKDSANPFFKSKYSDLHSVIQAIKGPLSKNGIAYTQLVNTIDGQTYVETVLLHVSGDRISGKMLVKPSKDDMQGIGSAITYARRYGLQAICGVSAEDDDGEAAVGRTGKTEIPKNNEKQAKYAPPMNMDVKMQENALQANVAIPGPIPEVPDFINQDDLTRLINVAVNNGYLPIDIKNKMTVLGYNVKGEITKKLALSAIEPMNTWDYETILESVSKPKKAENGTKK